MHLRISVFKLIFCCLILSFTLIQPGYPEKIQQNLGAFPYLDMYLPIKADKLTYNFLTGPLVTDLDDKSRAPIYFVRQALFLKPTLKIPSLRVGLGYDSNFSVASEIEFLEHRPWQEIRLRKPLTDRLTLGNRVRFEQRTFRDLDTQVRLRYRLKGIYKLGRKKDWYVFGQDEIFVSANKVARGREAGVDLNWAEIGVGKILNDYITVEAGYMMIYFNQRSEDRMTHGFETALIVKLPSIFQ